VMGSHALEEGSVWKFVPAAHRTGGARRFTFYYRTLGASVLTHFLGEPQQTRHPVFAQRGGRCSRTGPFTCGCGTGNYKFIWGMAAKTRCLTTWTG